MRVSSQGLYYSSSKFALNDQDTTYSLNNFSRNSNELRNDVTNMSQPRDKEKNLNLQQELNLWPSLRWSHTLATELPRTHGICNELVVKTLERKPTAAAASKNVVSISCCLWVQLSLLTPQGIDILRERYLQFGPQKVPYWWRDSMCT